MKKSRPHQRFVARSLAAFMLAALLCQSASAGSDPASVTAGFQFDFDQNLIVLDGTANVRNLQAAIAGGATGLQDSLDIALGNDSVLASMWIPYTSVLGMRERPGIFLSNDEGSDANIVGLEIVLDNPSNQFLQFGDGEYIDESFASGEYIQFTDMITFDSMRVDSDQVSFSTTVSGGGQTLEISFGNGGIQPGRATTFNVYASTGMQLQNFLNDDTQIRVIYEDSDTSTLISTGLLELGNIQQFNNDLMAQVMGGLNGIHFAGSVEAFSLMTPPTLLRIIPEPSSLLLLGGSLGLLALRRRRCRTSCNAV